MTPRVKLSRRRFLQVVAGTAGALVIGLGEVSAQEAGQPLELLGENYVRLGPFLRIEANGRVVVGARDPDCGEGTHTALPRILAEELDADWRRVEVVSLGPDVVRGGDVLRWRYGRQRSGDSRSVPAAWNDLRQAGALARWLLLQAAARRGGVAADRLRCEQGRVITPDGRRYDYGELAAAAADQAPPQSPPSPKDAHQYRLVGQPAGDVDAEAMVTGRTRFGLDHDLAEALVAVVVHCPWLDGSLESVDTADALRVHGVRQVLQLKPETGQILGDTPLAPAVAVLADTTWAAIRGRDALKLTWKPGPSADASTHELEKQARDLLDSDAEPTRRVRDDGDIEQAGKHAARRVEATYAQPFVAHALAETINCVARIDADRATLVVPTQAPQEALALVQRLTGFPPERIDIQVPRGGGGFGRRLDHDYVAEAVMLAQATHKPVKLVWTRDQDLQHDFYRPGAVHRLSASLDRHGRITGWSQRKASASALGGRGVPADRLWTAEVDPDALPAGLVDNYRSVWFGLDSALPRGDSRGGHHVVDAYATQVFLDEIAKATRKDPLALRLELLGEPRRLPYRGRGGALDTGRLAGVLKLAAERIDWDRRRTNGHGLGIAFHYLYGAYCAHAFEVSIAGERLLIHRAVCAVDVGRVVNPLGLEAQVSGATLDGISTALGQAIEVRDGRVRQSGLDAYPLARMAQLPRAVEVISVPSSAAPTGASELAMPSAAPALANAVFAATTVRIRRLPLMPELLRLL